jgi:DNA-binding HxlR family transcriptional regulator
MSDFLVNNYLYHNPVEFALSKIGGSYKMPILWRLKNKNWRFSELKKELPHISDRMLSKALKELEIDGLIFKEIFAQVPVRTQYSLTEKGRECIPVIIALRELGYSLLKSTESD